MGKIKSALEIALERTESVKSDKGSIGLFEAKQKGKKLANEFLDGIQASGGTTKFLEEAIKKEDGGAREYLKQGIFDVLLSRIALPAAKEDLKRIESAGQGLAAVIGNKQFGEMVKQFNQVMNQYMDEAAQ